MLEEIEFLMSIGCDAGPIIRVLQKRFPTTLIAPKSVYNAICQFQRNHKKLNSNATETLDKLKNMDGLSKQD